MLYQQDTSLCMLMTPRFTVSKSIEDVIEKLNVAANQLNAWCTKNHHTVHTGKTEAMIISNTYFVGPLQPVMFGNNMIKYVTESTALGVKIDNKLKWKSHLTKVTNSFNSKLKELRRLKYLPVKALLHGQIFVRYFIRYRRKTTISCISYRVT